MDWLFAGAAILAAWLWRENRRLRARELAAWAERLHYRRLIREAEAAVRAADDLIRSQEAKHGIGPWSGN